VSRQEGNEERQGNHHEEWQASNSGRLPGLRHQDVPHRQVARFPYLKITWTKTGILSEDAGFVFYKDIKNRGAN